MEEEEVVVVAAVAVAVEDRSKDKGRSRLLGRLPSQRVEVRHSFGSGRVYITFCVHTSFDDGNEVVFDEHIVILFAR